MFPSCFAVQKLGEELKRRLSIVVVTGCSLSFVVVTVYSVFLIKSMKEYSTPLLLIFATLVSAVGFYKTTTPYEDGDVKKLFSKENPRD